jgi:hypothetical protein
MSRPRQGSVCRRQTGRCVDGRTRRVWASPKMEKCAKSKPDPLQAKMHCRRLLPVLCTMAMRASAGVRSRRSPRAPSPGTTAPSFCLPCTFQENVFASDCESTVLHNAHTRDHALGTRLSRPSAVAGLRAAKIRSTSEIGCTTTLKIAN